METNSQPPTGCEPFHIGFTMAGAASAGCYTAGAMDYLFEIMDLWEQAKGKNGKLPDGWNNSLLSLVPQHQVIIDAMGGTSAGGMTTVMAAIYALKGKLKPVSDPANAVEKKNNVMYDSWVLMGDEAGKTNVLEKTLALKDLTDTNKIQSLLNSAFIDEICDNAFTDDGKPGLKFPYISDKLELVLSHTMLRGISLAVDFNTPISKLRRRQKEVDHSSFDHFTVSHFKLDYDETLHKNKYLPLKPFDTAASKALKLATMATGAFPVGLKFREFFNDELTTDYIKNITEKIAFNRLSDIPSADVPEMEFPDDFPNPYKFVSIDGGAINNEPFGEVMGILKERYGKKKPTDPYRYALVMIDPFPDVPSKEEYTQPDDLFTVVPAIIGTLWDQSKVKRAEMLDAYSSEYYRGEIFPLRWGTSVNKKEPEIACGAAMAFAGLLDIRFRQHDFFLGRDNARNFYRTYFSLPCRLKTKQEGNETVLVEPFEIEEAHPIHKNWSSEMIAKFKRITKDKFTVLLPIIPDLYVLKEIDDTGKERDPSKRTVPVLPLYDAENLFALKDKMKARVEKMLELSYAKITKKETTDKNPLTAGWTEKHYRSNWWKKLMSWIGGGILRVLFIWKKGKLASGITQAAIEWILKDLEEKKLLKKVNE